MTHHSEALAGANASKSVNAQPPILVAENLRKFYGDREALRGLSFSLQAGRVMGFLGPNGAGKTTSIRILTTMLEPSSGQFTVNGVSSHEPERIRHVIGVLPEGQGLPKHVTAMQYLIYFGQLYGRSAAEARAAGVELLKDVGMQHRADSLIGTYSHGMRQRLGIARALVNNPKVIFLDEPTLGLDPRGQQELLALIQRVARERNAGVVLSSHLLSEIEGICDDVVIMNSGQVVAYGTVAEVIAQTQQKTAQPKAAQADTTYRDAIRVRVPAALVGQSQQILQALPHVEKVTTSDATTGWLLVDLATGANGNGAGELLAHNKLLDALIRAEVPIRGFEVTGDRLQDVFLRLTAEAIQ